jgi:hypothetical protein
VDVVRTVAWRYLDTPGMEHCVLATSDGWWHWLGTAVAVFGGVPADVWYRIACAPDWTTRNVDVSVRMDSETRMLRLWSDDRARWRAADDADLHQIDGCRDVDLGLGASTNTLPIRRHPLEVGEQLELVAAWVRFPDLTVEPLRQRYTRLDEDRYRYESLDSGFTKDLDVDDLGMVVRYPDWCERIAWWSPPNTGGG